jgi:hypothetical protein
MTLSHIVQQVHKYLMTKELHSKPLRSTNMHAQAFMQCLYVSTPEEGPLAVEFGGWCMSAALSPNKGPC